VIYCGPGPRGGGPGGSVAVKVEKQGAGFAAKPLWTKTDVYASMYNTPTLKDGLIYGLTAGARGQGPTRLYCESAQTGDVLWTDASQRGDCGVILDAGSALVALTSDGNLFAFRPSKTGYEEMAKYKVAEASRGRGPQGLTTWSCPILDGKRIFVKDDNSVTLWTIE